MSGLRNLLIGIKKTNLSNEFITIIFISLIAAVLEILGLSAFSYLMVTIFTAGATNVNLFQNIFDWFGFIPSQNLITYLFISIFILNIFTNFMSSYIIHKIISLKYHHFRSYVFNEYIKKGFTDINQSSVDSIINKINIDPGKFLTRGFGSLCIIVKNLIILTVMFTYLIYLNFYTFYIFIFFMIFFSIYFVPGVNKFFKEISTLERVYNIDAFLSPANIIQNFKEIKIFFAEKFFAEKFYESSNLFYKTQLKLQILRTLPKLIIELILVIIITIIFIKFSQLSTKETTFIFFSTLVFALIRLIPYVVQISRCYTEILGSQEYVTKFLSQDYPDQKLNKKIVKEKILEHKSITRNKDSMLEIKELELVNINFSFKDKQIFDSLNLGIKKNQKILIYGNSGEGKSVLLEIISGFRNNFFGEILINGKKINKETANILKNNISLVSQSASFINCSLIENVAFGEAPDEIDEKLAKDSLKLAGLNEFCNYDKLYKFIINPEFKNISEGQAKRLSLARSFYFKKSIILLDETTANLDKKLEKEILIDLLNNCNLTLVLVTHDPALRDYFEIVYKVENKNIFKMK